MQFSSKTLTAADIRLNTARAMDIRNEWIQRAADITADADKSKRLERGLCPVCYYRRKAGMIGGAALTSRDCGCCGEPQTYGSTVTDALCSPCSKAHSLCKACGGDVNLDTNRAGWPRINPGSA